MDRRRWFPALPLFGAPACCYCAGPANLSDHTPPRCLLPKTLPNNVHAMTFPACTDCSSACSADENARCGNCLHGVVHAALSRGR